MILIVDDNAGMRKAIRSLLLELDSEFCECNDGCHALDTYRLNRPDWVLMDVRMPELDGITATKQIKSSFPDAQIIIVTEYDDPILRSEAEEAGAVGFVRKDDLSPLHSFIR